MAGPFFNGDKMASPARFVKKVRVESTFQIKHRLLLWWLKHQAAKETVGPNLPKSKERTPPMHVHDAGG